MPGCEETNECYVPYEVTIDVGGEVTWSNDDTAAHTVTSGSAADGPDGLFDSSLFMAGSTFSVKFDGYEPGDYSYFCMVHPWMEGIVTVQAAEAANGDAKHPTGEMHEVQDDTIIYGMTSDDSIRVEIATTAPVYGEELKINVNFINPEKSGADETVLVEHINYDISATQDGLQVLSDMKNYEPAGGGEHFTNVLGSNNPVDVKITILGIGENEPYWGPKGSCNVPCSS